MPMGKMYRAKRPKSKSNSKSLEKKIQKAVTRGVTSYDSIRTRSLIPKKSVIRFPYTALITVPTFDSTFTEDFNSFQFRVNDIFDPDQRGGLGEDNITATGFQHVFGTSQNNFQDGVYQNFTVLKNDISVTFVNESLQQGAIVGTYIQSINGASLNYRTMTNQPQWYKERVLGVTDQSIATISYKLDLAKYVGSDVRDLSEYRGTQSTSPPNLIRLYVMARNMNSTSETNQIQVRIKMNYVVECTIPRDLEKGE